MSSLYVATARSKQPGAVVDAAYKKYKQDMGRMEATERRHIADVTRRIDKAEYLTNSMAHHSAQKSEAQAQEVERMRCWNMRWADRAYEARNWRHGQRGDKIERLEATTEAKHKKHEKLRGWQQRNLIEVPQNLAETRIEWLREVRQATDVEVDRYHRANVYERMHIKSCPALHPALEPPAVAPEQPTPKEMAAARGRLTAYDSFRLAYKLSSGSSDTGHGQLAFDRPFSSQAATLGSTASLSSMGGRVQKPASMSFKDTSARYAVSL